MNYKILFHICSKAALKIFFFFFTACLPNLPIYVFIPSSSSFSSYTEEREARGWQGRLSIFKENMRKRTSKEWRLLSPPCTRPAVDGFATPATARNRAPSAATPRPYVMFIFLRRNPHKKMNQVLWMTLQI